MSKQTKFLLSVIVSTIIMLPVIADAIPVSWDTEGYTAYAWVGSDSAGPFSDTQSGSPSVTAQVDISGVCSATGTANSSSLSSALYAWSVPVSGSWGEAYTDTFFIGTFNELGNSSLDFTYNFAMSSSGVNEPLYPSFTPSWSIKDLTDNLFLGGESLAGASGTHTIPIIGGHDILVTIQLIGDLYADWGGYGSYGAVFDYDMAISPTGVPEPSTMLLLGSGLIGIGAFRKKYKK